jgi:hypothetical protein
MSTAALVMREKGEEGNVLGFLGEQSGHGFNQPKAIEDRPIGSDG